MFREAPARCLGMSIPTINTSAAAARESARHGDGKFGEQAHANPGQIGLAPENARRDVWGERLDELRGHGHVPARTHRASVPTDTTDRRDVWWDEHWVDAEFGHEEGDVPKMPDDYTPKRSGGRALTGKRRTHRMRYASTDTEMRMPSVASIRRFAADERGGKSFDVPVTYTGPNGKAISGWVRVSGKDGSYATKPLGFPDGYGEAVSESVACVLEARSPRMAMPDAASALAGHQKRLAEQGAKPIATTTSSWVDKVGYDHSTGTMYMETNGRQYGYAVPEDTYEEVATSFDPGSVYNKLVRSTKKNPRDNRVEVNTCDKCGNFYATPTHHCPPATHREPGDAYLARLRREAADKLVARRSR